MVVVADLKDASPQGRPQGATHSPTASLRIAYAAIPALYKRKLAGTPKEKKPTALQRLAFLFVGV
jgi:hypothetical protein